MAFTAKILSSRFRHLNIVGCLLKRRPTNGLGGGGVHGHPRIPLATPLNLLLLLFKKVREGPFEGKGEGGRLYDIMVSGEVAYWSMRAYHKRKYGNLPI